MVGHYTIRAEAAAILVWGLADLVVFQIPALGSAAAAGWIAATTSFGGGVMALVPATAVGTSVVGATGLVTAGSAVWAADSGCLDPLMNWAFSEPTPRNLPAEIDSGAVHPSQIPVNYIVRDGQTLILNTRTAQALQRAGIPRSQWNAINQSGNELYESLLSGQLERNGLGSSGFSNPVPE